MIPVPDFISSMSCTGPGLRISNTLKNKKETKPQINECGISHKAIHCPTHSSITISGGSSCPIDSEYIVVAATPIKNNTRLA